MDLNKYTGFGDYIKSGNHPGAELTLLNPIIDSEFLSWLKDQESGDDSYNFFKLCNPVYENALVDDQCLNY